MTLTISTASTVYIMYDAAATSQPSWLTSQFTNTSAQIVTQQGTFDVWSINLSAGAFTLGSNIDSGAAAWAMYNVLIVPIV